MTLTADRSYWTAEAASTWKVMVAQGKPSGNKWITKSYERNEFSWKQIWKRNEENYSNRSNAISCRLRWDGIRSNRCRSTSSEATISRSDTRETEISENEAKQMNEPPWSSTDGKTHQLTRSDKLDATRQYCGRMSYMHNYSILTETGWTTRQCNWEMGDTDG